VCRVTAAGANANCSMLPLCNGADNKRWLEKLEATASAL
jgi:hypothetical protein